MTLSSAMAAVAHNSHHNNVSGGKASVRIKRQGTSRRKGKKEKGVLTEPVANTTPRAIAECRNISPSVREFARGFDAPFFDPSFGLKGVTIRSPDGRVHVEGREGNLEDLALVSIPSRGL